MSSAIKAAWMVFWLWDGDPGKMTWRYSGHFRLTLDAEPHGSPTKSRFV
jgi:hypothetical protein